MQLIDGLIKKGYILTHRKILLSWSGGKDCSLALMKLKNTADTEIVGLLCTISEFNRVGLHGTRIALIEKQAQVLDIPIYFTLTKADSYENDLLNAIDKLRTHVIDFDTIAFGDIFLINLKEYREKILSKININPIFPIWGNTTSAVSDQIIANNIKAVLVCINHSLCPSYFLGYQYHEILDDIKNLNSIDICGENGEFHTFVYDMPLFKHPVKYTIGETIKTEYNNFIDIYQENNKQRKAVNFQIQ